MFLAFLTAFTISCAGTLIWSCTPIRASWDRMSEPNAKCFTNNTFASIGLFNSSKSSSGSSSHGHEVPLRIMTGINIITDVLFATLPIPVVWNLQVNTRTKMTLIGILSLGYLYEYRLIPSSSTETNRALHTVPAPLESTKQCSKQKSLKTPTLPVTTPTSSGTA